MPDFTSGITCFYNGLQHSAASLRSAPGRSFLPEGRAIREGAFVIKQRLAAER
jgi:hypothetical protein